MQRLCVKSQRVTTPLFRVKLRGPAANVSWIIFCWGRFLGFLEIENGHKQLGMERTTTRNLALLQAFQPGGNKLRHVLSHESRMQ